MIHPLDAALLAALPTLPMPCYGEFTPLDESGQRLLLGSNGVFLEVRRPWLHAVAECGWIDPCLRLPYGTVTPRIELPHGALPRALVDEFLAVARERLPNEVAGAMVLDLRTGAISLRVHADEDAGPARVRYHMERLAAHESLVVDIHSHGALGAGFSAQDDDDDAGATKIAVVVGRVEDEQPQIAVRLCLHGVFLPLTSGRWTNTGAIRCTA
ncbi:MAG TPA: PRTRC system protein A [Burkholderiaceae bacterium]|nr:PRTRC system protein A [Burkholderiaceae bacterium]